MPSLPLELWAIILRELTYEPQTLAISNEPSSKDFSDYYPEHTRAWRQNKCSAVLVCKTWRRLALPFLYEVLVLQDEVQAQKVLEVVAAERSDADGGPRGAFVRQILIREKLGETASILHDMWTTSLVSRIASWCPRMAIFSCRLRMAPHQAICFYVFLGSLRDTRSLRKLDFGSGVVQSAYGMAEILSKAVAALPQLETLVVPRLIDWECRQDELSRLLAMPVLCMRATHLRTLVVSWQGYVLTTHRASRMDVPALEEIYVTPLFYRAPSAATFTFLRDQLSARGDMLNTKVVSFAFAHNFLRWDAPMLQACFGFLALFPNLRAVSVIAWSMAVPEQPLSHPTLSSVSVFPVYYPSAVGDEMYGNEADATITSIVGHAIENFLAGRFPRLRTMYIVGDRVDTLRRNPRQMEEWTARLKAKEITLELPRSPC